MVGKDFKDFRNQKRFKKILKIYTVQSTVLPLISDNDHFMQVLAISCIFINQSSHSGTIQYIQYCSTELVVLVRAYSTWEQVKIKKILKSTALVDCWQVTRLCLMSVLLLYPGAHCQVVFYSPCWNSFHS